MNTSFIETGDWNRCEDGSWTQTTRVPLHARLHVPCEDGRIVAEPAEGSPPWSGWLRASCIGVELDGACLQLSLRSRAQYFLDVSVRRESGSLVLSMMCLHASHAEDDPAKPPPPFPLREHKDMADVWRDYREWMDQAWPRHPVFAPDWTKEIPAVVLVELWTGTGSITHTFEDLVRLLGSMH